jgi:hypothetical protein
MAKKAKKPQKRKVKAHRVQYDASVHPEMARALCLAGHTDEECFKYLQISKQTYYNWQKAHPEFREAVLKGKAPVDDDVESALLKRALGYQDESTEIIGTDDGDGGIKAKRVRKTRRLVPPDTVACIFWLKNRRPEKWLDEQHFKHSGDITIEVKDPEGWEEGDFEPRPEDESE